MSASIWTSRVVRFDPYTKHKREPEGGPWDALFEGLADHFYGQWWPFDVAISSCEGVMEVDGFPWWVPRRWAMQTVCLLAAKHGVGGVATFGVERSVLLSKAPR